MAKDTYIPREELLEMHKEFNKVRKNAEKELLTIPGVLSVGVGLKEIKGEIQKELCFKVTVEKKKEKSKIKIKNRIPETIYGFKTDVDETVITLPIINQGKYRPLVGGVQIKSSTTAALGTLGCFAKRNSDNKIVLLTNWHVVIDNATSIDGERVGQPNHNECCSCCATGEFATVVDGQLNTTHDAAIALINGQESDTIPDERYINEILGIGFVAGSADPIGGEMVYKYGRTTELTKGQILNDKATLSTYYDDIYPGAGSIIRTGVSIVPMPPHPRFLDKGDSGSVTVNEHNQVIVLNYSSHGGGRIKQVEADLGITILNSSFPNGTPNKGGVSLSSMQAEDIHVSLSDALSSLENELHQYAEGKRLLDLFKVHRSELLELVRTKREVMAAWHRYQGPAYLAHIARSVRRENKPIPDQIKGISLQNLLLKMTAVLQRNGSDELSKDVSENYLSIVQIISHGKSPEDWKKNLRDVSKPIDLYLT
jgi:hypothetical protein